MMCMFGIFVLQSSCFLVLKDFDIIDGCDVYSYDNGFLILFESYVSFIVAKLVLEDMGYFYQTMNAW